MSADLNKLYSARELAREEFVRATTSLKAGIAERLNDAVYILRDCKSALSDVNLAITNALDFALRDIRDAQCELTGADPGDAERTESEVADD